MRLCCCFRWGSVTCLRWESHCTDTNFWPSDNMWVHTVIINNSQNLSELFFLLAAENAQNMGNRLTLSLEDYAPVICNPGPYGAGEGNSGDIDFSLYKAPVYARHCGESLMVKVLPKALLKSRQLKWNYFSQFGHGIQSSPAIPQHCEDNAEVKTWHLSPANPGPMGGRGYKWLVHYPQNL